MLLAWMQHQRAGLKRSCLRAWSAVIGEVAREAEAARALARMQGESQARLESVVQARWKGQVWDCVAPLVFGSAAAWLVDVRRGRTLVTCLQEWRTLTTHRWRSRKRAAGAC